MNHLWSLLNMLIPGSNFHKFILFKQVQDSTIFYLASISGDKTVGSLLTAYCKILSLRNGARKCYFFSFCLHFLMASLFVLQFSSLQLLSRVRLSATPWTATCQVSLSITNSQSPPNPMSIELVIPSNHLILFHPLLLLPSIFPSIRVFSNDSALHIRWPNYWSFSFNISPFNEHPGLISFRMDWLDLLAVQGTFKSLLQHHSSKSSILWCSALFIVQLSHPHITTGKTIALTRRAFVDKGPYSQGFGFSCGHVWMWELDYKESWAPKNWCLWTVVLEKTLESPLDCKEIQPVHPEGNKSCIFIGRTDVEAETPILWPPDAKSWHIWKDPDAQKDWGQEEKGTTEDEMVGWRHWLNGHEFEKTPGNNEGQGTLV